MMADDAPNNADDDSEDKAGEATAKKKDEAGDAAAKKKDEATEPEQEAEPEFDPDTCRAIAIGLDAFWEGVHSGEWSDSEFEYYLEPAGVMNGPLRCTRAPEDDPQRAGLLMTRAGWKAKKVALDDELNPDTYELSFPKEFGYVKPLAHYVPETYEHAKYPWSKKY
jgi:hypothetical protein